MASVSTMSLGKSKLVPSRMMFLILKNVFFLFYFIDSGLNLSYQCITIYCKDKPPLVVSSSLSYCSISPSFCMFVIDVIYEKPVDPIVFTQCCGNLVSTMES